MFTVFTSYLICVVACLAVAAGVGIWYGRERTVGAGVALSMLAGTWFAWSFQDARINVCTTVAIVLMLAYCVHSGRKIWSPLTMLDCLVAAIVIWHVVVDVYYGESILLTPGKAYCEWALPYVTGRYAVLYRQSLYHLAPWFVGVGTFIAVAACLESFSGWNLWETLFAVVDDSVLRTQGKRYGLLHRAIASTRHPIFLSILFLLLLPWPVAMIESAGANAKRRYLGIAGACLLLCGFVATVSRGPVAALLIGIMFVLAIEFRFARWMTIGLLVLGSIFLTLRSNDVLYLLDTSEAGKERPVGLVVEIDGESERFSGTRNRLLILKVYAPLVLRGGALGYGTQNSRGFPPRNIPGLPADPQVRERLGIIDNSYLNMGLRFGCVGLVLLIGLLVGAIWTATKLVPVAGTYFFPTGPATMLAFIAVLVATSLEMGTVFFHYDYRFWLLFVCGTIAGLNSSTRLVLSNRTAQWSG